MEESIVLNKNKGFFMKNALVVVFILCSGVCLSAEQFNDQGEGGLVLQGIVNLDNAPVKRFKRKDALNHIILARFTDKRVRESILFAPEMKEQIRTLQSIADQKSLKRYNLSNESRDYALGELSQIYRETGILLKHIRSNGLGYDQFHIETNDIEQSINDLMNTGRFISVKPDVFIKKEMSFFRPISDKEKESANKVGKFGFNLNAYRDELVNLQTYLDTHSEGNMGSHGFFDAIDYAENNNNLGRKVRIAVIDTGYFPNEDIDPISEGMDFVSAFSEYQDCLVYDETNRGEDAICSLENFKLKERDEDPTDKSWIFPTDENGNPTSDGTIAIDGHGLAVASTIGAKRNDRGLVGALGSNNVDIVHVRGLGFTGGIASDVADAIIWSAGGSIPGVPDISEPVDIINLSLGESSPCDPLSYYQEAILFARDKGIVVVAAAGNSFQDASGFAPASCEGVLTVGANDYYGEATFFSNFGELVDVTFEGSSVLVSSINTSMYLDPVESGNCNNVREENQETCYGMVSGTSFSAPLASSAIGLLMMVKPELTQSELRSIIQNTAPLYDEDIYGNELRRKIAFSNAGIGNVYDALITPFDRLFIDNLKAKHQFSSFDTDFGSVYLEGLFEFATKDTLCGLYDLTWNNFTDEVEGITYTIYGNRTSSNEAMTEANSEIIESGLTRKEYLASLDGYTRLGVQSNNGDIFEFDLSTASIPRICL